MFFLLIDIELRIFQLRSMLKQSVNHTQLSFIRRKY